MSDDDDIRGLRARRAERLEREAEAERLAEAALPENQTYLIDGVPYRWAGRFANPGFFLDPKRFSGPQDVRDRLLQFLRPLPGVGGPYTAYGLPEHLLPLISQFSYEGRGSFVTRTVGRVIAPVERGLERTFGGEGFFLAPDLAALGLTDSPLNPSIEQETVFQNAPVIAAVALTAAAASGALAPYTVAEAGALAGAESGAIGIAELGAVEGGGSLLGFAPATAEAGATVAAESVFTWGGFLETVTEIAGQVLSLVPAVRSAFAGEGDAQGGAGFASASPRDPASVPAIPAVDAAQLNLAYTLGLVLAGLILFKIARA